MTEAEKNEIRERGIKARSSMVTKIVPPITFRLYQSIRFNRPVNKDTDYISPGGYELEMEKETGERVTVRFDFEDSESGISKEDPAIVECVQKNPDMDEFEDLLTVTDYMLGHVTKCVEWFIYTGEADESDLHPLEIIDPTFVLISDYEHKDLGFENIPITVPINVADGLEPEGTDAEKTGERA